VRAGRRRREDQQGAAAVEFALVVPILFLLMFGILQYGLWFFDTLGTRQGVREAARMGVVRNFPSCGTATNDMDKLRCETKRQIDAVTGTTYVRVVKPSTWQKGAPLVVCAMVKSNGGIGLLPLPSGGWITTKTQMSVEEDTAPVPTGSTSEDSLSGTGQSWTWCA
jgi:hypothetical protein